MEAGSSNGTTSANEQRKRAKDGSTDETPRVKRQRVSRACDQCRAGREKCDGVKPKCGTCAFSERTCTYDTQAKKRGIQPGYIRTLELCLAWLFTKYPAAENVVKTEIAIENSALQKLLSSKEGPEPDRWHSRWSKGIICKQIDQLLSGVEVSTPSQFGPDNAAEGADDILTNLFSPDDDPRRHGGLNVFPPSGSSITPGRSKSPVTRHLEDTTDNSSLRLPADFWRLLDVYYAFTHSWLPISEKHDMLKTAYSYPPEGLRLQALDSRSGSHAELWAILALASHQITPRKQQDEIDTYMVNARRLLPQESGPFELGHVRAIILLCLIHIGRGDHSPAWVLIGIAIRMAYDLRLQERADIHLPRRKHVFLACYVVEEMIGRLHGMPCHLKGQTFDKRLEEDGLEEWNPWDGGVNVTSQQALGLARKPAQSMSIFNRLLSALRDDESRRDEARIDQRSEADILRRTMSSNYSQTGASMSFSGNGKNEKTTADNAEDSDPWTPQQLHYEVISLWLRSERSLSDARDSWPAFTQKLKLYIQCFGAARIPPTGVPLLERLLSMLDLDIREAGLRNTIGSLSHIWRREVPIQAIAFQTTPGQDASPASFLGDPVVSGQRHSMSGMPSMHAMNLPPMYNNAFNVDHSTYNTFTPALEPRSNQASNIPTQPNIPNPGVLAPNNFMAPSGQHASASSTSAMTFVPQEQSQTADLEAIFEEIAALDGNRQSGDRPEFMRNLGLGPDLDLSAFFGADYQPSDPLFSYLQPDSFGNVPDNHIFPDNP